MGSKKKRTGPDSKGRTSTVTLSISEEDSEIFKKLATEMCMSRSDLLHYWIKDASEKGPSDIGIRG